MEPWQSQLANGDAQGAWDLFAERYGRLILATIRRLVPDHDDVMDVYSTVCHALSSDDCARLRRYTNRSERRATVATWLVVVVRNRTVDWLRQQEGRRRTAIPAHLSPLQEAIYRAVCIEGASHVEAYEGIRARSADVLSFTRFIQEIRETNRIAPCPRDAPARVATRVPQPEDVAIPDHDPAQSAELVLRLGRALAAQPTDIRLAVELFVIDGVAAADVARAVGWPNAKAVYNKVYRALETLRAELKRDGLGPGDL